MSLYSILLLFGCLLYVTAFPEPSPVSHSRLAPPPQRPPNPFRTSRPVFNPNTKFIRVRRFTDNRHFNGQSLPEQKRPEWEVRPDLSRDNKGNTRGEVTVKKHGENHDVEAQWGQNIRGPNKHSETWKVGGSIRW